MIEKMKFMTLSGPIDDLDRVVFKYLVNYEIQYENAAKEYQELTAKDYFTKDNPYKTYVKQAQDLISYLDTNQTDLKIIAPKDAFTTIETLSEQVQKNKESIASLKKELDEKKEMLSSLKPFCSLDLNLNLIQKFKYLKIQFGRFPALYYEKFKRYIFDYIHSVFFPCLTENEYVYGFYCTLSEDSKTIDSIYQSLHFQTMLLPKNESESPGKLYDSLATNVSNLEALIHQKEEDLISILKANRLDILTAYKTVAHYDKYYDIRKFCICFGEPSLGSAIYTLCGFIPEQEIGRLMNDLTNDSNVFLSLEDATKAHTQIPTKLKNPRVFRPFELFIRMYGMPSYTELDPTIFVALTYSFMFGMMFGDVGQGALLVLGGFLLYRFKHIALAGAICLAGIISTIFGFLYGSFFGFEDLPWLPALWLNPMQNVMAVLVVSIAFGAFLILVAMILNIINGARVREIGRIFFDPSGFAGFIFYGTVILLIVRMVTDRSIPSGIALGFLLGIPLLFMFFREPLTHFIEKKKEIFPESKAMFLLEGIVELFEILLSYITNTISFVRVGAFALSHAGMMGVVLSLAHVEEGNPNVIILVLGNLLVMGLEGLIVGIQVLRLEYYEMFSRFYHGTGKEFKPY